VVELLIVIFTQKVLHKFRMNIASTRVTLKHDGTGQTGQAVNHADGTPKGFV